MSLFSVMNVANRALHASQIGMEVTGQNMSNADVAGYSRKRINLAAAYQRHTTFGQFGFGVDVLSISRIRNEHIDAQIRRQSHQLGMHRAVNHVLESMENILREPSDTGILEYMNRFFDSWESLINNPADLATRNVLRANANMLCNVFHNAASELENLRATRNMEMVSVVSTINNIATEIFNLNGEISLVQLQGQFANDSLDRRDQLMRELSELIDFEVIFANDGQVTITTGGNIIVSPTSVNRLEIFEDSTTRTHPDADHNQFGVRMEKGKNLIMPRAGALRGLMDSRDVVIPAMEAKLDELARGLVQAINEQHRQGFNLLGFTGFDFFDPTGLTARTINLSASINTNVQNIAAAGGAGNPIRVTMNNAKQNDLYQRPISMPPATFDNNQLQLLNENGIPMRNVGQVRIISSGGIELDINSHYTVDSATGLVTMRETLADGITPNPFFGNSAEEFNITFLSSPTFQLTRDGSVGGDPARNITAGSVRITAWSNSSPEAGRQELHENVHFRVNYALGTIEMLPPYEYYDSLDDENFSFTIDFSFTQSGGFTGVGDNRNAVAIAELRRAMTMGSNVLGQPTATFDQFYGNAIADLGLNRREAIANVNTREHLIAQFDAHQDAIAGVSLDEEMANLIKYQYTYQAAARIFSTAQAMLDILMNL